MAGVDGAGAVVVGEGAGEAGGGVWGGGVVVVAGGIAGGGVVATGVVRVAASVAGEGAAGAGEPVPAQERSGKVIVRVIVRTAITNIYFFIFGIVVRLT
jgi:hypothetical protein